MKIEAEVGVRIPEVRESQDLPEAGNGTENPLQSLWRDRGPVNTLILDSWLPER